MEHNGVQHPFRVKNYFFSYNSLAPLIVILFPKGIWCNSKPRKLQLWVTKDNIQSEGHLSFMDETDASVCFDIVRDNWQVFKPIFEWALEINPMAIQWFPIDQVNCSDLSEWLGSKRISLDMIDDRLLSQELCIKAVMINKENLLKVPERFQNDQVFQLIDDDEWHRYITYVPKTLQVRNQVMSALKSKIDLAYRLNLSVLEPDDLKEIVAKKSNRETRDLFYHLSYIRSPLLTEEIVNMFVEDNPVIITGVPDREFSDQAYELAMKKSPELFSYIPDKFWTHELMERAVQKAPYTLMSIPEHLLTVKIIDFAIDAYASNRIGKVDFKCLDKKWLDRERCLSIISIDADQWSIVDKKFIDQDFCIKAFASNPRVIYNLPKDFIREEWWVQAVIENSTLLYMIPNHLHTQENYLNIIVKSEKIFWTGLKTEYFSPEICLALIAKNPVAIRRIPEKMRDLEMCRLAVLENRSFISSVPESLKHHFETPKTIPEPLEPDYNEEYAQISEHTPEPECQWNQSILISLKTVLEQSSSFFQEIKV